MFLNGDDDAVPAWNRHIPGPLSSLREGQMAGIRNASEHVVVFAINS